jgi:hypothetical protein
MALAMRVLPLVEPPGVRPLHQLPRRKLTVGTGQEGAADAELRVLGDSKGFKSLSEDGDAGRYPHLAWVLREGQKSATIHSPSEVIWESRP